MNVVNGYAVNPGWGVLLTDLGISRSDVLRRARLPGDLFVRGPTWLTPDEYYRLWVAAEEEAADPALPIRVGRALTAEVFDTPIFAALCSENLNVAARRIAAYKKLIGPMRLRVTESPSATTVEYAWPEHALPPGLLVLTELAFWTALVRIATRAEIKPLMVSSPILPAPPVAAEFTDYFGVRVSHQPTPAITFSAADAARPFLTANRRMWDFFEPELRKRLADLGRGATMAERVRVALLELLPAGDSAVAAVARRLAVSSRTLQRRLKNEGTTFQSVLNTTRENLARHYLASSNLPTAEIAYLLGYEETSSFYRAFREWTGRTPERVRVAAR